MSTKDFTGVRLKTKGNIQYKRLSSKISETLDGIVGTEVYVLQVSDVPAFLLESIPRDNTFAKITLPRKMPGAAHLSCTKVDVEAADDTRPIDVFTADLTVGLADPRALEKTYGNLAKVTITYEAISRNVFRDRTVAVGAEYLHIPPSNVFVVSDNPESTATGSFSFNPLLPFGIAGSLLTAGITVATTANQDNLLGAYKLIPTAEWTYKLHPFADPPWTTVYYGLLGKVNSVASPLLCENAAVETVLFSGLSATQIYTNYAVKNADGTIPVSWLIELKFSQRNIIDAGKQYTWNHVYSPKLGKWTKLERAPQGSGKYLYDSADLAKYIFGTAAVSDGG